MSKKNRKDKRQRRKAEILKAQSKSGLRGQVDTLDVKQPKKLTHRLHVSQIKTDLVKTGLFAIFVVILLVVLKQSGLQLDLGIYK